MLKIAQKKIISIAYNSYDKEAINMYWLVDYDVMVTIISTFEMTASRIIDISTTITNSSIDILKSVTQKNPMS